MGLTFPRYPRKRLRSSTAIRTRGGIPHLPSPVLRCDDPFERCNRDDRHQPTTQSAHDSTGRDPRDDCSVLQPLRHWDVCTGRDRWRREGECLDGSSLEHVRVPACSFREPHGICDLRIGPVMANECDPFIETSRAASRAGIVVRLPIILRIRYQCASTTAKSAGAPLAGTRTSNRTCQGSRTEGTTARIRRGSPAPIPFGQPHSCLESTPSRGKVHERATTDEAWGHG